MSIYVKDLFHLKTFKNFKVIAGEKGLNRKLVAAQVLDFEFVDGLESQRKVMFDKGSLVISSLLFAKDNESILMEALKTLVDLKISAFAYKNVIYKKLPQEVIDFANNTNLPILEFQDEDAYFEDIIFAIMNLVKMDSRIVLQEERLKNLIKSESQEEVASLAESMNPYLQVKIQVFYIESDDEKELVKKLMSFNPNEKLRRKCIVSKYNKDLIIIVSTEKDDKNLLFEFEDVLFYCGLQKELIQIGISNIHTGIKELKKAIEEAIQARIIGQIETKKNMTYGGIGLYQILLPEIKSQSVQEYMQSYLKPILDIGEGDSDLLKTAIQFVLASGDMVNAANRLFCHKNTVRYRVKKIHELIDNQSNEFEFFGHLNVAIKIYLINKHLAKLL